MKKQAIPAILSCAFVMGLAAVAVPAAWGNPVVGCGTVLCKLCGAKYPDAKTLLRNTCPRNHGGKHVLFEGEAADKFICENCGITYSSLKDLTRNTCPHGNGAAHVPYRGGVKAEYTCRWCGHKYQSLKDMTRNSCPKHPDGKGNHRPTGM